MKTQLILVVISYLCCTIGAIRFHLSPNSQKCLKDEMQANQLIVGEYEISGAPGQIVDYEVDIKKHNWNACSETSINPNILQIN